jgi:hypothetical protein
MPLARKASFGWSKCAAAPADRLTSPSVHGTGIASQMIPTEFRKEALAGWYGRLADGSQCHTIR